MLWRNQKLPFTDFPLCAKYCICHYLWDAYSIHEVKLIHKLKYCISFFLWRILEELWSVTGGIMLRPLMGNMYASVNITYKALCKVEGEIENKQGQSWPQWVQLTEAKGGIVKWVLRLTGCGKQKTSQFGGFFIGLGSNLPLRLACLPALTWPLGQQLTWSPGPSPPNSQVSPAPSLKCVQMAQPLGSSQYVKYMSWDHSELAKEIISYMYQDLPVIGLWLPDG